MKKPENMLREYVRRLSDEDVKFLFTRLTQRLTDDMADALNFLSKASEVDRWLSTAKSSVEFFNMLDLVFFAAEKEYSKRFSDR